VSPDNSRSERIQQAVHRVYADLAAESRAVEIYTGQMAALRSRSLRRSVARIVAEEREQLEQLSTLARDLIRLLPTVERRGILQRGRRAVTDFAPVRWGLRAAGWLLACLGLRAIASRNARSENDSARSYTAGADQFDWNFPKAAHTYRQLARTEERHARWFASLLPPRR
jgi:rubrerythrin